MSKILVADRVNCPVLVFETSDLETPIAVVEFDLIIAFTYLVNGLAHHGIAMDAYLAEQLNEHELSFKSSVMERFVNFRSANGIELDEDATFCKTKDVSVYEV